MKVIKFFVLPAILLFLFSACSEDSSLEDKPPHFDSKSVQFDVDVDKNKTRFRGDVWKTVYWEDAKGKNTLILSARPKFQISEELYRKRVYGYHYLETPDTLERINYMTDAADSCMCDCDVYLVDKAFYVADFNSDEIGDVWFAYYLDNRCDVGPIQAKLQLWSGGKWVALSGFVRPPENKSWEEPLLTPEIDGKSTLQDPVLRAKMRELWNELFK